MSSRPSSKRRRKDDDEASEEGSDDESVLSHEPTEEDLIRDEEDREALNQMSEVEREMELAQRYEAARKKLDSHRNKLLLEQLRQQDKERAEMQAQLEAKQRRKQEAQRQKEAAAAAEKEAEDDKGEDDDGGDDDDDDDDEEGGFNLSGDDDSSDDEAEAAGGRRRLRRATGRKRSRGDGVLDDEDDSGSEEEEGAAEARRRAAVSGADVDDEDDDDDAYEEEPSTSKKADRKKKLAAMAARQGGGLLDYESDGDDVAATGVRDEAFPLGDGAFYDEEDQGDDLLDKDVELTEEEKAEEARRQAEAQRPLDLQTVNETKVTLEWIKQHHTHPLFDEVVVGLFVRFRVPSAETPLAMRRQGLHKYRLFRIQSVAQHAKPQSLARHGAKREEVNRAPKSKRYFLGDLGVANQPSTGPVPIELARVSNSPATAEELRSLMIKANHGGYAEQLPLAAEVGRRRRRCDKRLREHRFTHKSLQAKLREEQVSIDPKRATNLGALRAETLHSIHDLQDKIDDETRAMARAQQRAERQGDMASAQAAVADFKAGIDQMKRKLERYQAGLRTIDRQLEQRERKRKDTNVAARVNRRAAAVNARTLSKAVEASNKEEMARRRGETGSSNPFARAASVHTPLWLMRKEGEAAEEARKSAAERQEEDKARAAKKKAEEAAKKQKEAEEKKQQEVAARSGDAGLLAELGGAGSSAQKAAGAARGTLAEIVAAPLPEAAPRPAVVGDKSANRRRATAQRTSVVGGTLSLAQLRQSKAASQ